LLTSRAYLLGMSTNIEATGAKPDLWTVIKRGLSLRCPVCGEGKLFRSYLKPSERCSGCGTNLSELRADDGPAWATILIVGHLIVPFFIVTVRANAPDWVYYVVLFPITIAMTLLLLPRSKGVFVGLLYAFDVQTGVPPKQEVSAS
jgi:uncharacterized protein (DUF983 family)